jgi:hypothetical protein
VSVKESRPTTTKNNRIGCSLSSTKTSIAMPSVPQRSAAWKRVATKLVVWILAAGGATPGSRLASMRAAASAEGKITWVIEHATLGRTGGPRGARANAATQAGNRSNVIRTLSRPNTGSSAMAGGHRRRESR